MQTTVTTRANQPFADGTDERAGRTFAIGLTFAALVAVVVRVSYVLVVFRDRNFGLGDQFYFVKQGELIARGYGFIDPHAFALKGIIEPSSAHPPLFSVYNAGVWLVHLRTPLEVRFAACALGVAAVVVVGLAARQVAGPRAGILAALLAAVMPYLWINDAKVLSESLLTLVSALTLLAASSFWHRPTALRMAWLSAAIAAMALTRAESVMLYLLLALPLAIVAARRDRGSLWRPLGACVAVALLVLGPWVAYNMSRFEGPSTISNGMGATLAVSNCDQVYSGAYIGWWSLNCGTTSSATDEAKRSEDGRRQAQRYMKAHLTRLPAVMAARVGRLWGVFRPWQTATLEASTQRGLWPSRIGWILGITLLPFAGYGVVVLRRRRETVIPMVAMAAMVTLTAALFWGGPRFGVPLDVAVCVLAGAGLDGLWVAVRSRRNAEGEATGSPAPAPLSG